MTNDAKPHPLPKPKFTDRERAAWDWLHNRNVQGWLVDMADKRVYTASEVLWRGVIEYAQHHGWEG